MHVCIISALTVDRNGSVEFVMTTESVLRNLYSNDDGGCHIKSLDLGVARQGPRMS